MQIVIDIPEEDYNFVKRQVADGITNPLKKCIAIGTPLPKGHGRLIEVTNQLERELFTFQRYTGIDEAPYESAVKVIDEAPTIIERDKAEKEDKE